MHFFPQQSSCFGNNCGSTFTLQRKACQSSFPSSRPLLLLCRGETLTCIEPSPPPQCRCPLPCCRPPRRRGRNKRCRGRGASARCPCPPRGVGDRRAAPVLLSFRVSKTRKPAGGINACVLCLHLFSMAKGVSCCCCCKTDEWPTLPSI